MRRHLSGLVLCCLIITGVGAPTLLAQRLADFGLNENDMKQRMVSFFANNSIIYPDKKLFKAAAPAARAAFIRMVLSWMKIYCESSAFKADYDKQREAAKPAPPASKGSPEEQWAKYLADQQKNIETMKKNLANMSPDMQKQMAATVKQTEAGIEKLSSDQRTKAIMMQGYQKEIEDRQKGYQARLAVYDAKYPADPNVLIANRLRQFLKVSNDVDFNAKLVSTAAGMMKFADQQYEAKPYHWKLCYRAGKEPVEAARAFVADWLRQLEGK